MTHTLITDYGFVYMKNPTTVWIKDLYTRSCPFGLFFEDDVYKRKLIYQSFNLNLLKEIKDKIIDAVANGEERIDIR